MLGMDNCFLAGILEKQTGRLNGISDGLCGFGDYFSGSREPAMPILMLFDCAFSFVR